MKIKLLVEGGNMTPGPAIAQQLGPMGINIGQVISKVNESTKAFKGTKVPVELDVDAASKEFTISVSSPPVAELLKKELGLETASGDHKKIKVGNLAIEQIISIAKTKLPDNLENDLKAMVKSVVGTCVSLGILVESKSPIEVSREISDGKYDKEIKAEKSELSEEKKKELKEFFSKVKAAQDAKLKVEAEQKSAAEAKPEVPATAEAKPDAKATAKPAAKPAAKGAKK